MIITTCLSTEPVRLEDQCIMDVTILNPPVCLEDQRIMDVFILNPPVWLIPSS